VLSFLPRSVLPRSENGSGVEWSVDALDLWWDRVMAEAPVLETVQRLVMASVEM
jgi:hypothetical protein